MKKEILFGTFLLAIFFIVACEQTGNLDLEEQESILSDAKKDDKKNVDKETPSGINPPIENPPAEPNKTKKPKKDNDHIIFNGNVDIKKISDKGNYPKVSDKYVVWDSGAYNIKTGKIKKLDLKIHSFFYNIHSNKLVYYGGDGIYMYDLDTDENEMIVETDNAIHIDFNDKYLVWGVDVNKAGFELYLYDIKKEEKLKLTNGTATRPKLYDNKVVWVDMRDSGVGGFVQSDIYLYDIKTEKEEKLTKNLVYVGELEISIYENIVTFSDRIDNNFQIFIYDLDTKQQKQITKGNYHKSSPHIYKNLIAWEDYGADTSIYVYDLKQNKEFFVSPGRRPEIYGDYLVWDEDGGKGIYLGMLTSDKPDQIQENEMNKSDDECKDIESVRERDICYYNLAFEFDNDEICYNITGLGMKSSCIVDLKVVKPTVPFVYNTSLTISDPDYQTMKNAILRFVPYCNGLVEILDIFVNEERIFSTVPVCGDPYRQPVPKSALISGTNEVIFDLKNDGEIEIGQVKLEISKDPSREFNDTQKTYDLDNVLEDLEDI